MQTRSRDAAEQRPVHVCVAAGDVSGSSSSSSSSSLLVLFDQHAVDERIRLERFSHGKQSLSFPRLSVPRAYLRNHTSNLYHVLCACHL